MKWNCKDLFVLAKLYRSDNMYNIEVDGPFVIHILFVHNLVTANQNRLKFWI